MKRIIAATALLALLAGGCVHKGAKIVEGTDLAVGLNVPGSEGSLQFQLFNWLSGFRLGVAENAILTVRYSVAETNDFLGVFHVRSAKEIEARVEPCLNDGAKAD